MIRKTMGLLADRKHAIQLFVGIPLIVGLYIGWPWILAAMGEPTSTFGMGVFEPIIIATMYVMIANYVALAGSRLNDQEFPISIKGCNTQYLLYLQLFSSVVLLVAVMLLGGRAPA